MKISEDEVRYVARLANLELTGEEVGRFASQLSDILQHMEALNEDDAEDVVPILQVIRPEEAHPLTTPFRDDTPRPSLGTDSAISNAPDRTGPYFRVPKVIAER